MNNLFMTNRLISMVALTTIMACSKADTMDGSPDHLDGAGGAKGSLSAQQVALEKIGTILLSIATIEEFRAIVYAEVDLRFDGETNVLLRTLLDIPFADTRVTSAMTSMRMLLETFDGIEGRCYHPHLFIPMYDRHKQEGSLGQGRPVMMVYLSEEELSAGTGQQFDDSGALVPIEDVDEEFAKTKEVWVLAINERVDEKGDVLEPVTKLNSCEAGEVGGDDPDPIIGVVLNKITIKEHKESWLAGGSEIHILGFRTFWNGLYPSGAAAYNEGLAFSGPANEGPQLLWVSRGDVDAHVEHIVNFPIGDC